MRRLLFLVLVLASIILLSGCRLVSLKGETAAARRERLGIVTFKAKDGVKLSGKLWGQGQTGVILAHMYPADQKEWKPFAEYLAKKDFTVLTFDFRGYGGSSGKKEIEKIDRDVEAAIELMRARGARKIILIGASMGGTAAIKVAQANSVDAIVSLSAPTVLAGLDATVEARSLKVPILLLATKMDISAVRSASYYYRAAKGPKQVNILRGYAHGSEIVTGPGKEEPLNIVSKFLAKYR